MASIPLTSVDYLRKADVQLMIFCDWHFNTTCKLPFTALSLLLSDRQACKRSTPIASIQKWLFWKVEIPNLTCLTSEKEKKISTKSSIVVLHVIYVYMYRYILVTMTRLRSSDIQYAKYTVLVLQHNKLKFRSSYSNR